MLKQLLGDSPHWVAHQVTSDIFTPSQFDRFSFPLDPRLFTPNEWCKNSFTLNVKVQKIANMLIVASL